MILAISVLLRAGISESEFKLLLEKNGFRRVRVRMRCTEWYTLSDDETLLYAAQKFPILNESHRTSLQHGRDLAFCPAAMAGR